MPQNASDTKAEVELVIQFQGEEHTFVDLCMRCRDACANYFKSITKQRDEAKEGPEQPPEPEPEAKKKSGFLGRAAS